MMNKLEESVQNRFRINYSFTYVLKNIEMGKTDILCGRQGIKSRWFNSFPEGQAWLKREEENRLEGENIGRRATKFGFERHMLITNRCRLGKGICQVCCE